MAEGFQVDLDGEQVLFDGIWYTQEDLAQKIRTMVDGGDYRVSRPSAALEILQSALQNLRALTIRLPVEQAEALAAEADRQGMSVGAFARDLLLRMLPQLGSPDGAAAAAGAPSPPPAVSTASDAPSPEEVANAIPLTPKRRDETDAEKDWFNRR